MARLTPDINTKVTKKGYSFIQKYILKQDQRDKKGGYTAAEK